MNDDKDPAHESDMRQLAREQLRLDCDPCEIVVIDLDDCEPVLCEPWPLEDLEF